MRSASLTMPRSFQLALTTGGDVILALDSTARADFTVVPRGTVIASLLMTSRTNIGGSSHRRWLHAAGFVRAGAGAKVPPVGADGPGLPDPEIDPEIKAQILTSYDDEALIAVTVRRVTAGQSTLEPSVTATFLSVSGMVVAEKTVKNYVSSSAREARPAQPDAGGHLVGQASEVRHLLASDAAGQGSKRAAPGRRAV